MKKKILFVLSLALVCSMAMACGGDDKPTPSQSPSEQPSQEQSLEPSETPSEEESEAPSEEESQAPSETPSEEPSAAPSEEESEEPSEESSELVLTENDFFIETKGEVLKFDSHKVQFEFRSGVSASAKDIVWESLDDAIASVDENGVVAGIAEGKTTITATVGGITKRFEITVKPNTSFPTLMLKQEDAKPCVNGTVQMQAWIRFNQEDKKGETGYVWTSENPAIATVDENGLIKGVSVGTTTVTVSIRYGGTLLEKNIVVTVVAE